jgi:hypothetical protein
MPSSQHACWKFAHAIVHRLLSQIAFAILVAARLLTRTRHPRPQSHERDGTFSPLVWFSGLSAISCYSRDKAVTVSRSDACTPRLSASRLPSARWCAPLAFNRVS